MCSLKQSTFWQFFGALEIVINVALILLPIYIIQALQMGFAKKSILFSCFGARILCVPLGIFRAT